MAEEDMFRPPINRAMRVLDKTFFRKEYPTSAAKVFDMRTISRVQKEFVKSKDLLNIRAVFPVQPVPAEYSSDAQKCILLRPQINYNGVLHIHEWRSMK